MRALLEFLGIVQPEPGRREPVALPAWAKWLVPALVVALTLASTLIFFVLRVLFT